MYALLQSLVFQVQKARLPRLEKQDNHATTQRRGKVTNKRSLKSGFQRHSLIKNVINNNIFCHSALGT
jgi:hypothetical protein